MRIHSPAKTAEGEEALFIMEEYRVDWFRHVIGCRAFGRECVDRCPEAKRLYRRFEDARDFAAGILRGEEGKPARFESVGIWGSSRPTTRTQEEQRCNEATQEA